MQRHSTLSGFSKLPIDERRQALLEGSHLAPEDLGSLDRGGLDLESAEQLAENVIGTYGLPMGVATHFRVNGLDYLVPMVTEEPGVVAAASSAARIVRDGGGFEAEIEPPWMIAQIQVTDVRNPLRAKERIESARFLLLEEADRLQPRLVARGGGARDIEVRLLPDGVVVVHVLMDCRNFMGAHLCNAVAEGLCGRIAVLAGGRVGLYGVSHLADRRRVRVTCQIPFEALHCPGFDSGEVARGIAAASRFAESDPYRAATHNKTILNGIDAAVLATGNDFRAVEAAAHAYAATSGEGAPSYAPLATWREGERVLTGVLELPLALGVVGGTLRAHEGARLALRILGIHSSGELAMVVGATGLATNLAALRAVATDSIRRGGKSVQARSVLRPERAHEILDAHVEAA